MKLIDFIDKYDFYRYEPEQKNELASNSDNLRIYLGGDRRYPYIEIGMSEYDNRPNLSKILRKSLLNREIDRIQLCDELIITMVYLEDEEDE